MEKTTRTGQLNNGVPYQRKAASSRVRAPVMRKEERKANLYDFFKRMAIIAQTYTPRL